MQKQKLSIAYRIKRRLLEYAAFLAPDTWYLKWQFQFCLHRPLDLKNPRSFNEKLQWLKLYYRKPELTQMVDKVAAKDYVASLVGQNYLVPTLGVWNSVDEIDWDILPNQFVIKSSGDSGGIVICRDKSGLDIESAKAKLWLCGSRQYWRYNKEYPYKDVPHRYIAEAYLEEEGGVRDYKFFCFDGEPKYLYLSQGLEDHSTARISFLDIDWQIAPFRRSDYEPFKELPEKPLNYDKMIEVARVLSKGLPHVRIDLYNINGKIYFGEMTFFTCSGMVPFEPEEWDYRLGSMIKLPDKCN